jgi:hypothetical protein
MEELVNEIEAFCKAARMQPGALFRHAGLSRVTWHDWKNGAGGATIASEGKIRAAMDKIKSDLGSNQ